MQVMFILWMECLHVYVCQIINALYIYKIMKLKIRIRSLNGQENLPTVIAKGDWVDLASNEDVQLQYPVANRLTKNKTVRSVEFPTALVGLGVAMELPKGFEAIVASKSSSYRKYGFILMNSIGVIDNVYNGDTDEWKAGIIAISKVNIKKGDEIVQFRIQLSQKATIWQKLKWLLCSGIEFQKVDILGNISRGGGFKNKEA